MLNISLFNALSTYWKPVYNSQLGCPCTLPFSSGYVSCTRHMYMYAEFRTTLGPECCLDVDQFYA